MTARPPVRVTDHFSPADSGDLYPLDMVSAYGEHEDASVSIALSIPPERTGYLAAMRLLAAATLRVLVTAKRHRA